jgi:hypothetical protein
MKQFIFLLFAVILLMGLGNQKIYGQTYVCSPIALDVSKSSISGRTRSSVPLIPIQYAPCGGGSVDWQPYWLVCRPSGTTLSLSVSFSNCSIGCGQGGLSVWEGESCGTLHCIGAVLGNPAVGTFPVSPCKAYYIVIDAAISTCVCNFILSYNKNELFGVVSAPIISGSAQICKNVSTKYCATTASQGCEPNSYKWTLNPVNAGTVTPIANEPGCANVKITNPPTNG